MKTLFRALVLGSAIAFAASAASAQDTQTTTQNPFGQEAQAGTANTAGKKKRELPQRLPPVNLPARRRPRRVVQGIP